jgi:hypothetical protein
VVAVLAAGFAVPAVVPGLPTVGGGSVGVRGAVASGVDGGHITGVAGGALVVDVAVGSADVVGLVVVAELAVVPGAVLPGALVTGWLLVAVDCPVDVSVGVVARLVAVEPPAVVVVAGPVVAVPLVVVPVALVPVAVVAVAVVAVVAVSVVAGPEDPALLLPVVVLTWLLAEVAEGEPVDDDAVGEGLPDDGEPDPDPDPDDAEPGPAGSEGVGAAGGVELVPGIPAGTGSGARLGTYERGPAAATFGFSVLADAPTTPGIPVQ